jgi:hypothetical protein
VLLGLGLDPRDVAAERAVPGTFAAMLPEEPRVQRAFASVAAHVQDVLASVRALGAWVPSTRPDTYAPVDLGIVAAAARRSRVLVFLTHHDVDRGLQLGAHMVPFPAVLEAVGQAYSGTIDLGACQTKGLAALARASCPRARFLVYDDLHRLEVRASIIRAVQRCLPAARRPYIDVATDVLVEMAIQSRTWSGDDA